MKIFVDSANCQEIENWLRQGVIDGATTNPSIMFKDGVYDVEEGARRISELLGERPLSVEVTTNDPEEMIRQGCEFASWASNIVVKIPIINESGESCLGAIHALREEGIRVNATAILSFNQAALAAKAGGTYVSIFAGRVADEGNDPCVVIRNVRKWLDDWRLAAEIIVGSIRSVIDVQNAALAGSHHHRAAAVFPQNAGSQIHARNRAPVQSGRREGPGANRRSPVRAARRQWRVSDGTGPRSRHLFRNNFCTQGEHTSWPRNSNAFSSPAPAALSATIWFAG